MSKSFTPHLNTTHRLHGLTNPQQRARPNPCTTLICSHKDPKIPTINTFQENFRTQISERRPHRKISTLRSSIKNISSPALVTPKQKHHAALERITPAQRFENTQKLGRLRADDKDEPLTTRICSHKNPKIPTINAFQENLQTSPPPQDMHAQL